MTNVWLASLSYADKPKIEISCDVKSCLFERPERPKIKYCPVWTRAQYGLALRAGASSGLAEV